MPIDDRTDRRESELVLSLGVYAFVQDNTKGQVNVLSGPTKTSLSNTDLLVVFDRVSKRFLPTRSQAEAIQNNVLVPKGSYVVLENPTVDGRQPEAGKTDVLPSNALKMGQTVNLPGPANFPLWPGQVATVIKGHQLRTNQYLQIRIVDDEVAKANWDSQVVKTVPAELGKSTSEPSKEGTTQAAVFGVKKESLVTGQILIIRGTEVSFYIPPTGIEVLTDESGAYIQEAVTLEQLEYSILLDESGNKEYKTGPTVVFPTPTQRFFTKDGARKFRAFELQPTTGIHVKVTAPYEEDGQKYAAGDELFITGTQKAIYFPRPEHFIITYGGKETTYSIAIPAGQGRYVLDRKSGEVNLITGSKMFLPDPRNQVIVRRILSHKECELYFPGNERVAAYNESLRSQTDYTASANVNYNASSIGEYFESTKMVSRSMAKPAETTGKAAFADVVNRSTGYTAPRSIILDTSKYEGAVNISVWSGYAVQVVNSKGQRRVVVGPQTVILEYDEYLERLSLSKGKPKNSDNRMDTVYLRHQSNAVSDILSLRTEDMVPIDLHVKYLVRFEENEQDRWFSIDNYIQYMVDHLRSMLGNVVRSIGIQNFYSNAATILRDTVLGVKDASGNRPLKHFAENGMTIYDVELIGVGIKDSSVAELLADSRRKAIEEEVSIQRSAQRLEAIQKTEANNRGVLTEQEQTSEVRRIQEKAAEQHRIDMKTQQAVAAHNLTITAQEADKKVAEVLKDTVDIRIKYRDLENDLSQKIAEQDKARQIELLQAEAAAAELVSKAVQPNLIGALTAIAQVGMLKEVAEHLAPLAIVQDLSVAGTLDKLTAGTALEGLVGNLKNLNKLTPAN